jgi:hypothetical protein
MAPKNVVVPIHQSYKKSPYAEERQIAMAVRFHPVVSSAGVKTENV